MENGLAGRQQIVQRGTSRPSGGKLGEETRRSRPPSRSANCRRVER